MDIQQVVQMITTVIGETLRTSAKPSCRLAKAEITDFAISVGFVAMGVR